MSPREQLNRKEIRVATMVFEGKTNPDIAACVGSTEQVVKNQLRRVFDKLGVWSRLELALYVAAHGGAKHGSGNCGGRQRPGTAPRPHRIDQSTTTTSGGGVDVALQEVLVTGRHVYEAHTGAEPRAALTTSPCSRSLVSPSQMAIVNFASIASGTSISTKQPPRLRSDPLPQISA
jgi:DNA-binding CsgD family transcriptional regulator